MTISWLRLRGEFRKTCKDSINIRAGVVVPEDRSRHFASCHLLGIHFRVYGRVLARVVKVPGIELRVLPPGMKIRLSQALMTKLPRVSIAGF